MKKRKRILQSLKMQTHRQMPQSQQLKQKLLRRLANQVQLLSLSLRNQLNLLSQRQIQLDQLPSQSQAKQVLQLNKNLNSRPNH